MVVVRMTRGFYINIYFLIPRSEHGQEVQSGMGYGESGNSLPLQILGSHLLPLSQSFTISPSTFGLYIMVQISFICYITWL